MTKIRENGAASGVGVLATYAWDNLGRRASLTRGDGSVLSYGYDAVSRLTSLADNLVGTAYDQTLGFGYTPTSQIASNTRSSDAYAWTGHYNLNRSYTANGRNQYTAVASITPTYDTKGNLTSAGATTYAYTSENLLTSASGGIALAYDPGMRLYQTSGGSAGTTRFAYDSADLIAEYNGSNAMLRRYVHGPGTDEPLVWYEGSGTTDRRFLHSDERGSVVAVTNSSGTTLNVNGYDEYGIPSSSNMGRFQYTGQTWLAELGMYYYKARIYSPTLGRFLQTDPIGYGDGMNIYAYVREDPINTSDPSGTCQLVDVGYSWYTPSGEYLGPAPGKYFVLIHCAGDLGGSGNFGSGNGVGFGDGSGGTGGPYQWVDDGAAKPQDNPPQACQIAWTPDGNSKGENPRPSSGRWNTDLPGSWKDAWAVFQGLSRLAGEPEWTFTSGPSFSNATTLAVSKPAGAIRLRVGYDYKDGIRFGTSPRIDIKAGTFDLRASETIHFTGGKGNMCPTR
jgi:RHS repeat-associated protein